MLGFASEAHAMTQVSLKKDFTIDCIDGTQYRPRSFQEDLVLLFFGRTGCGNTRGMILNAEQALESGISVRIVLMDVDSVDSGMESYAKEHPKVIVAHGENGYNSLFWELLRAAGLSNGNSVMLPGTFIMDGSRTIVRASAGYDPDGLQKALRELSEPAACTHVWSAWKTTAEATALAKGQKERSCLKCGEKETAGIPKLTPSIKLNASKLTLKAGQSTAKLKVSGLAKGDRVKSWKSSRPAVVKVDAKGKLTAGKTTGKATVTVTLASGLKKSVAVTVQKTGVRTTKISGLPGTVTLEKGKTQKLKPVIRPITSREKVTYASSDKKVVTVSSGGLIKAVRGGSAKITVRSGKVRFVVKVTVPGTPAKTVGG